FAKCDFRQDSCPPFAFEQWPDLLMTEPSSNRHRAVVVALIHVGCQHAEHRPRRIEAFQFMKRQSGGVPFAARHRTLLVSCGKSQLARPELLRTNRAYSADLRYLLIMFSPFHTALPRNSSKSTEW